MVLAGWRYEVRTTCTVSAAGFATELHGNYSACPFRVWAPPDGPVWGVRRTKVIRRATGHYDWDGADDAI